MIKSFSLNMVELALRLFTTEYLLVKRKCLDWLTRNVGWSGHFSFFVYENKKLSKSIVKIAVFHFHKEGRGEMFKKFYRNHTKSFDFRPHLKSRRVNFWKSFRKPSLKLRKIVPYRYMKGKLFWINFHQSALCVSP